jgi:hypothetical protein
MQVVITRSLDYRAQLDVCTVLSVLLAQLAWLRCLWNRILYIVGMLGAQGWSWRAGGSDQRDEGG